MFTLIKEETNEYTTELLDLRNDFVFKTFFSIKRNNHLLLSFINAILEETVTSVEIINANLDMMHIADKASVMDLRIATETREQINIEMQVSGHRALPERMLMYWAKMYASQDEKGSSGYKQLRKVTQILIADFKLLPKSHFHSKFQLIDKENLTLYSEHIEFHVIELPKVSRNLHNRSKELEKWLLFLKGNTKTKEEIAMESSTFKEAFEEIERLSQDPKTRALAISREKFLRDQNQRELEARIDGKEEGIILGIEQGIEQGALQAEEKMVLTMHAKGNTAQAIADLTDIPLERVKKIINK
ncbi:Rpn family recombination-promoting nuclease/putative transposase [Psychrobacillus sp. NPDC093180]|uniref:Rpn family recombination-promoting nuclease/putative transposase n=1 Tax=Psychrobacillus sp. NPDC093180 TaxID=3364489 RepID=UPI0038155F7D